MTESADLAGHLGALTGARILCIGDVMLDRFVYGEVSRVSPEAPIPICRVTDERSMLGGAGNVVRNLVALGARVDFISVTGEDDAQREVTALLSALDGVETTLLRDPQRLTTVKTRYIASGQQLLRADREKPDPIVDGLGTQILARAAELLGSAGALVLSDYDKGVLTPDLTKRLIDIANDANVPVLIDPKGADYSVYRGARLVTPNRQELALVSGHPVDGGEQIVAAARHVIDTCGVNALLVTRGADGMTFVTPAETAHLPAEAREVYDVSGAGDTVVAAMAASLASRVPDIEAARLANFAAGIVVARSGTAVAALDDLRAAIRDSETKTGRGKIVSLKAALDRVTEWRRRGDTIGFTNGVFDLLHPGHLSLLAEAQGQCGRLIVGMNSDASVKRLKGPERPVQGQDARQMVLASLSDVDLVVLFDDDTPISLIEAIRPDILVKGADYAIDQVVGADIVQGYGGRVVLAEIAAGHSTTDTISRAGK